MWFGSLIGLSSFDGQTWAQAVEPKEFIEGPIAALHSTRDGDLWVGTRYFGTYRHDGITWTRYDMQDGLAGNSVQSILSDDEGNVWAATPEGTSRFDGVAWTTHSLPAQLVPGRNGLRQSQDGALWINVPDSGTDRPSKAIRYVPDSDAPETRITLSLETVSHPGNTVLVWTGSDPWRETPNHELYFAWRLDGRSWSKFSQETNLILELLPPGKHTFEVKARDRDFNEDPSPAAVTFLVIPPNLQVQISDILIHDIFVSFSKTYAERKIGSALVANDGLTQVEGTISFYIPEVMSRPAEHRISLPPGSEQLVTLRGALGSEVLNLEGERSAQAEIALSSEVGDQVISVKETRSITIYGRGALAWDTLGRAAAFVTPEDRSVSALTRGLYEAFRHQVKRKKIDGDLPMAALLFEALNTYGIKYAQDSSTPYSQVRGDKSAVDHIQYPAELLRSKMGDCDDCTVLYCALLENLNIPTAFVDAPSHLLMMFDSGVTTRRELGFALDKHRYIQRGDHFWIPVEVTALGEGSFLKAWELGAATCDRLAADGELQITDVRAAWAEYPYALPEIELELEPPDGDMLGNAFASDISGIQKMRDDYVKRRYLLPLMDNPDDYGRRIDYARSKVEGEEFNDAVALLMPLLDTDLKAEAHYLIGFAYAGQKDYPLAIRYFEKALEGDPDNVDYAHGLDVLRELLKKQGGATR